MVEFGKKLLSSRVEEWKEYYIHYNQLKSLINDAVKDKQQQKHERQHANDAAAKGSNTKLIEHLTKESYPPIHNGTHLGSRSNTHLVANNVVSEGCVTVWAFRRMVDHEIQKLVRNGGAEASIILFLRVESHNVSIADGCQPAHTCFANT